MTDLVQYRTDEQGYGEILLNRPEKMNAISKDMTRSFLYVLETAKQQQVKFLVITASVERIFCTGGKLQYLHDDLSTEKDLTVLYTMKEVLYKLVSFTVPTVCLLNGDGIGDGCEITTACFIRIAKENTR